MENKMETITPNYDILNLKNEFIDELYKYEIKINIALYEILNSNNFIKTSNDTEIPNDTETPNDTEIPNDAKKSNDTETSNLSNINFVMPYLKYFIEPKAPASYIYNGFCTDDIGVRHLCRFTFDKEFESDNINFSLLFQFKKYHSEQIQLIKYSYDDINILCPKLYDVLKTFESEQILLSNEFAKLVEKKRFILNSVRKILQFLEIDNTNNNYDITISSKEKLATCLYRHYMNNLDKYIIDPEIVMSHYIDKKLFAQLKIFHKFLKNKYNISNTNDGSDAIFTFDFIEHYFEFYMLLDKNFEVKFKNVDCSNNLQINYDDQQNQMYFTDGINDLVFSNDKYRFGSSTDYCKYKVKLISKSTKEVINTLNLSMCMLPPDKYYDNLFEFIENTMFFVFDKNIIKCCDL